MNPLKRLLRHSSVYGAALILSKSLVLLLLPVYSRQLSVSEYGIYSLLLTSVAVLTGVVSLGLGSAVARHAVLRNDASPGSFYATSLAWHAVTGVAVLALAWVLAPAIAAALVGDPARAVWVRLAAATSIVTVLNLTPGSYLRHRERSRAYSVIRVLQFAGLGGANVVALVVFDAGITALLANELAVGLAAFIAHAIVTRDGLRDGVVFATLSPLLRFGLPLVPATLAMTALSAMDRYVLNALGFHEQLGLYAMAYRFGFLLYLLVSAIQTAWPPIMYAAAEREDAPARFAVLYTTLIGGFLWIGVALTVVSPPLVALLTPREYWPGTVVIPLVVAAYVLHGIHAVLGNALYQKNRTWLLALALVAATGANLVANLSWIPRHGMLGAAWATLLAYGVLVGLTYAFAQMVFPVRLEWSRLCRLSIAAAAAVGLSRAVSGELDALRTWFGAALGICAFPVGVVLLRVPSAEERAALVKISSKCLSRVGLRNRTSRASVERSESTPVGSSAVGPGSSELGHQRRDV